LSLIRIQATEPENTTVAPVVDRCVSFTIRLGTLANATSLPPATSAGNATLPVFTSAPTATVTGAPAPALSLSGVVAVVVIATALALLLMLMIAYFVSSE
jgi:hypothetical protein